MRSDIIVVGGGAAGLMAAIGAAKTLSQTENGGIVTVLEKMQRPGRKIMVTGKGRCNYTNVKDWDAFSAHIRTDSRFASAAWHNLTPEALVEWFRSNGMASVVERGDRAFPQSHFASDVVDTLVRTCTMLGVKIVRGCEIKEMKVGPLGFKLTGTLTTVKEFRPRLDENGRPQGKGRTETTVEDITVSGKKLIIATGGLSYPWTGSTGDGYRWAEHFGHEVEPLYPALTALVPVGYKVKGGVPDAKATHPLPEHYPALKGHIEKAVPLDELGELLNGNTLENVRLTTFIDGVEAQSEFGDIEFTDGGLEGPVGFQVSRKAVLALMNGSKVSVSIDLKPAVELEKLDEDVHQRWEEVIHDPRSKGVYFQKLFRIMLGKLMPWNATLPFLKCNPKVSVNTLASALKDWRMEIAGFVGFERCVVTAGGVSTDEVVAKTLESKKVPGLYFAGEVLDMDCDTGGYNLHTAFSTGLLAGESAAKAL